MIHAIIIIPNKSIPRLPAVTLPLNANTHVPNKSNTFSNWRLLEAVEPAEAELLLPSEAEPRVVAVVVDAVLVVVVVVDDDDDDDSAVVDCTEAGTITPPRMLNIKALLAGGDFLFRQNVDDDGRKS